MNLPHKTADLLMLTIVEAASKRAFELQAEPHEVLGALLSAIYSCLDHIAHVRGADEAARLKEALFDGISQHERGGQDADQ
jgi:hypothetical protein